MDLWRLHIFCKVVELKSFSKAGSDIRLSQPTVSAHIKDLEDHFGCRLIDRLSKEAVPTKAGELLHQYARRLLKLRDEMETALSEFHGKIEGNLAIGASTIPGGYILPRMIGPFNRKFPAVRISLVLGDTVKIIQDVLSGSLEFGIVGAKTDEKMICQKEMIEDEMRLIVPAGGRWRGKNRISIQSLLDEPFIVREPGSGTLKSIAESLNAAGYALTALNIASQMGGVEAVKQGIKSNAGVSILSTLAVSEELKSGELQALAVEGLNLKRYFYLTRHKYRTPSPVSLAFIDFLYNRLNPDDPAGLPICRSTAPTI